VVCANGHTEVIAKHLARPGPTDHGVGFFEDSLPRGTAGCLKSCQPRLSGRTIFVTGGSVFLDDDPEWMVGQHQAQGNALTVFCSRDPEIAGPDGKGLLRPVGVYCCAPAVLDFIRPHGFQDLKEQVVPALKGAGLRVGVAAVSDSTCEVADWATYVGVLDRVLSTGRFDTAGYTQVAPGIWFGDDVKVAPGARIVGPALLGHGCRIDDGSVLIGPTVLGNECRAGDASWLVRVVAADGTHVAAGTSVADRFLSVGATARAEGRFDIPDLRPRTARWRPSKSFASELTLLGASVWGWGSPSM
jgi:mannose-1-phosphate guanylyltransferase/phosphomannomutase